MLESRPQWRWQQCWGACSKHEAAGLHAAARAVSGACVYVSDKPGQHDFSILKQLVLSDGSVLRCLLPGRPTLDCLFLDPLRDNQSLLKVCPATRTCPIHICSSILFCHVAHPLLTLLTRAQAASGVHLVT